MFEWLPVRANGAAFAIQGNEITIPEVTSGAEVELDLRLSGWGMAPGNPLLHAYTAKLDDASFSSGWGASLTFKDAFIITNTCSGSGNPCTPPFDSTCDNFAEGFCVSNPDHPFDMVTDLCQFATGITYCGMSLNGLADAGNSLHGGYLILEVPPDATGTYTISLDPDVNITIMVDTAGTMIPGLVLTPALITIPLPVGRCCSNIGQDVVCEDNVTAQDCAARPEPRLFTVGETCDGACACPTCLSDTDCNDSNECTIDTCDTCGQCVLTPIYDVNNECCNPESGQFLWIDDGDGCTIDTCDPLTGIIIHDVITNCTSWAPDDFPKNRYLSFETGVLTVDLAFQVRMTASAYFPGSIGNMGWVGAPDSKGTTLVVPDPVFLPNWPAVVRAGDCEIVPAATYEIRATGDGINFDPPVVVETTAPPTARSWGDIVGDFNGMAWSPPNGVLNFSDVQAAILTFQNGDSTAPLIWADIGPVTPDRIININEVLWLLLAFIGEPYPFSGPADCP